MNVNWVYDLCSWWIWDYVAVGYVNWQQIVILIDIGAKCCYLEYLFFPSATATALLCAVRAFVLILLTFDFCKTYQIESSMNFSEEERVSYSIWVSSGWMNRFLEVNDLEKIETRMTLALCVYYILFDTDFHFWQHERSLDDISFMNLMKI